MLSYEVSKWTMRKEKENVLTFGDVVEEMYSGIAFIYMYARVLKRYTDQSSLVQPQSRILKENFSLITKQLTRDLPNTSSSSSTDHPPSTQKP